MNNDESTLQQSNQSMSHNNSRVKLMNKTPSSSAMPKLKGAANPTESIIAKQTRLRKDKNEDIMSQLWQAKRDFRMQAE